METIFSVIAFLNGLWSNGLEVSVWILGIIPGGLVAAWFYYLPRYTAVCFHDGQQWIDLPGVWSAARGVAGNDLEQFVKQWAGQALTGRFIETRQARIPVNPVPRRYRVFFFGHRRGIYYLVGMRIFDQELLTKFPGRVDLAPVKHEDEDEYLSMR